MLNYGTLEEEFSLLNEDLHNIEAHPEIAAKDPRQVVEQLVHTGLFSEDLENTKEYLIHHIDRIDRITQDVPLIIQNLVVEDNTPSLFEILNGAPPGIKPGEFKTQLQINILGNLAYYKKHLSDFLEDVETKLVLKSKDKVAAAGFKIKLNLTNEQIANLFISMLEAGVIASKKSDGSDLTQKDLANFIGKNFSSQTKQNISIANLENSFASTKRASLPSIKNELKKVASAAS